MGWVEGRRTNSYCERKDGKGSYEKVRKERTSSTDSFSRANGSYSVYRQFLGMKFRYHKLLLRERSEYFGSSLLKPIISIKVIVGEKELSYATLIDSGADFCIFDAEIGEYLGINVRSGKTNEFGGIQERGGATAFLHKVTLSIGGLKYITTVGFSYDIARHGFGILGQKGFFESFVVKFDYPKEEIELKSK